MLLVQRKIYPDSASPFQDMPGIAPKAPPKHPNQGYIQTVQKAANPNPFRKSVCPAIFHLPLPTGLSVTPTTVACRNSIV